MLNVFYSSSQKNHIIFQQCFVTKNRFQKERGHQASCPRGGRGRNPALVYVFVCGKPLELCFLRWPGCGGRVFFCNGNHYLRDTSTTMLISLINSTTLRPLSRQWELDIPCIVIAIPMSFMQWKMFAYYICHRQVWGIRCSGIILKQNWKMQLNMLSCRMLWIF